jgi:DNA-binding transcriptional LysR family regulator
VARPARERAQDGQSNWRGIHPCIKELVQCTLDAATSFQVEGKLAVRASLGAIAAAVEGLGIVMTPLGACRRELERGELVRLLPEWDAGTVELNAVYASGRAAKPSARAFVDYLIAALHETEPPPSSSAPMGKKLRPSA